MSDSWSRVFKSSFDAYHQALIDKAKDEIATAVATDSDSQSKRKFPPMPTTGRLIRAGMLPPDLLVAVSRFLACDHRNKRGIKSDSARTRQDDIDRALLFHVWVSEDGLDEKTAFERLCRREKLDDLGSAQRAVKRGIMYIEEETRELNAKLTLDRFVNSDNSDST